MSTNNDGNLSGVYNMVSDQKKTKGFFAETILSVLKNKKNFFPISPRLSATIVTQQFSLFLLFSPRRLPFLFPPDFNMSASLSLSPSLSFS